MDIIYPINYCPKCKHTSIYRKERYKGQAKNYNTLSTDHNQMTKDMELSGEYFSHAEVTSVSDYWYCAHCHKRLFKDSDIKYNWEAH